MSFTMPHPLTPPTFSHPVTAHPEVHTNEGRVHSEGVVPVLLCLFLHPAVPHHIALKGAESGWHWEVGGGSFESQHRVGSCRESGGEEGASGSQLEMLDTVLYLSCHLARITSR